MKKPTVTIKTDVLEAWLRVADWSQSELATALQVSRARVSQLFHCETEPSAHLIAKLLVVTQLPFERLFVVDASSPNGDAPGFWLGQSKPVATWPVKRRGKVAS